MTLKNTAGIVDDGNILSADRIRAYLHGDATGLFLTEVLGTAESTNDIVRCAAHNGAAEGYTVIADSQTGGRGRGEKKFFSPPASGLYMSVLLRPSLAPSEATLITTAAAVAVAKAIEHVSSERAEIKWVNDVFMRGKKVCGILTESALCTSGTGRLDYAVMGMGVNILPPNGGFPDDISSIATSVFCDRKLKNVRNRLAAEILNEFLPIYRMLPEKGFFSEYRERLFIIGKSVTVIKNDTSVVADVIGIDENFRLEVRYENGKEGFINAGEVSIVK